MAVMPLEEGFEVEEDVEVVSGLLRGIKERLRRSEIPVI